MANAIEYKIYPYDNVFVAKALGDLDFEDISAHVAQLLADPDFHVGLNGLYDFTATNTLSGRLAVFERLAHDMSDEQVIDKSACTAILIPKENTRLTWMMEGYLLMTSGSKTDYKIFDPDDMEQALKHINLRHLPG